MTEAVRLVIWDLDETFWSGTLTEGGITLKSEAVHAVTALAKRGIISSICSKNDLAPVRDILEKAGVWDYFVLPSVNWEPKGPRLAALVEAFQLRPATVMFVDDNPANLNEALYYVPELQVSSETIVDDILYDGRFVGKDDSALKRLAQYKLLERRKADQELSGSDVSNFLRDSNITVEFEFDLAAHIDRAVELINRTNQLNFTKARLPEDSGQAREELLALVSQFNIHAALLRVTDKYGDHGYSGLYITQHGGEELVHFCFSCRILGMGVETWLYNRIGRPRLYVEGAVLTDVINDDRQIDWIKVKLSGQAAVHTEADIIADTIIARGGCDLSAVTHYLEHHTRQMIADFNVNRDKVDVRRDHSMFLWLGMEGLNEGRRKAFAALGFKDEDVSSELFIDRPGSKIWLLSMWPDAETPMYAYRENGVLVPFSLPYVEPTENALEKTTEDLQPSYRGDHWVSSALSNLKENFSYFGTINEDIYKSHLDKILSSRPRDTLVIIVAQNAFVIDEITNEKVISSRVETLNGWLTDIAARHDDVHVLNIRDFIQNESEVHSWSHFDRMVYYRIYQEVVRLAKEKSMRPVEAMALAG